MHKTTFPALVAAWRMHAGRAYLCRMPFRFRATLLLCFCAGSLTAQTPSPPVQAEILLLGTDHLSQLFKKDLPTTDVFTPKRQREVETVVGLLARYRPDAILVEVLPEHQPRLDSLYTLFQRGKLNLSDLDDGRSEVYQFGFNLGKRLGLPGITAVNAPGGTSQGILDSGRGIERYRDETAALRAYVKGLTARFQAGTLTLGDYLTALNEPATVQLTHHLVYITPARVTHGTLKADPMVDSSFIHPAYVGAEFISVFKNRDYKIYSNVVTNPLAQPGKRLLLIIGQRHVGSLRSIFRDDPEFKLVDANAYLKPD